MKFGIIGNIDKYELNKVVALLVSMLDSSKMDYVIEDAVVDLMGEAGKHLRPDHTGPRDQCVRNVDMLIALGGDGTMLTAARAVGASGIPIIGVNLGKLGFLAEVAPEEMEQALGDILNRKYHIEERIVLEATTPVLPGKVLYAINDVVVDKSRSSRVIEVETYINGDFAVTYRGDGLIISTPTGSTAYALSNGGPIVTPVSNVIGITPIAPHTLSGRPLIVPDTDTIRMVATANKNEILLSTDGQEEGFFEPPIEVFVKKADHRLRLVKRIDRSYYDTLRAKLLWGKDARSA
jgi:NAD+ kinase